MKRFIIFLLVALTLLMLCSCANNAPNNSPTVTIPTTLTPNVSNTSPGLPGIISPDATGTYSTASPVTSPS